MTRRTAVLRLGMMVGIACALVCWSEAPRAQLPQPSATTTAGAQAPGGRGGAADVRPATAATPTAAAGASGTLPSGATPPSTAAPSAAPAPPAPTDCARSQWCQKAGLCTLWGGRCVAGSDQDCAYSEACRTRGLCAARRGVCASEPCRVKKECKEKGYCTWLDGKCQAGSVADCRQARICTEDGRCMLNTKHHNCSDGERRRSTGAMIAGIVLVGVSGVAAIVGTVFMAAAEDYSCESIICPGPDEEDYRTMGIVALVGGGVTLATGLPLLIYGAPKVTDEDAVSARRHWQPVVQLGPTGGSVTWRF